MKCAIIVKMAAAAVVVAGLAGCQDLKPLQADIDIIFFQEARKTRKREPGLFYFVERGVDGR